MKKALRALITVVTVLMLMQLMTGAVSAAVNDLVWTYEPSAEKKIDFYASDTMYSETFGVCFQSGESEKYGTIDKYGNVVIPSEYDAIRYIIADKYAVVFKDGEYGIINSNNEPVVELGKYDYIGNFNDSSFIAQKDDKYALVSFDGKQITDFVYSYIENENKELICAKKDDKYGIINPEGEIVIPFEYESSIQPLFNGKMYIVGHGTGHTYLIDSKGKTIVDNIGIFSVVKYKEALSMQCHNGKEYTSVYMDSDGNLLKEDPLYTNGFHIQSATENCYVVFKGGQGFGLVDKNMNVIIPYGEYSHIGAAWENEDVFCAQKDGTQDEVYLDSHGQIIDYLTPYSQFSLTKSGYVIGKEKENKNFGIADKNQNVIAPFEYKHIWELADNLFAFQTYTDKIGIAEFGVGKKVKDSFDGLILKINSNTAKAFNEDVEIDAAPILRNGRTMLPARFITENLGKDISWDEATQTVTIGKGDIYSLKITIGSLEAKQGPYSVKLDSPAFIENGRTYLPVRFIAERIGADVFWDEDTQTVKILKKYFNTK